MKWSIALLLVSGLGAAVCAAFLVGSLRADQSEVDQNGLAVLPDVDVLIAAGPLPAMTVLDAESVTRKKMPAADAPALALSSSVQVVGKVLKVPMVEGQPFTNECFATEGSGVHLVTALAEGKRAMSIILDDYNAMDGLIYPGSVVDVLASFRTPTKDAPREAVATTLLERVQVLAVEEKTVVSKREEGQADSRAIRSKMSRRKIMITLLLDSKQAKILKLANEHGTVSLTLRNPLDRGDADLQMTSLGELLGGHGGPGHEGDAFGKLFAKSATRIETTEVQPTPKVKKAAPKPDPMWEVTILRGGRKAEKVLFPMPIERRPVTERGKV